MTAGLTAADFAAALRAVLRPGMTVALGDGVGALRCVDDGGAVGGALRGAGRGGWGGAERRGQRGRLGPAGAGLAARPSRWPGRRSVRRSGCADARVGGA